MAEDKSKTKIAIRINDGGIAAPDLHEVGNGWWIRWECTPDVDFSIDFEGSCPFENKALTHLSKAQATRPNQIFTEKLGKKKEFKYSITSGSQVLDPKILVDPDKTP